MTNQPPSLRDLAKQLGCTHSALSAAVHGGRLSVGVRIDDRGRVVVTDAAAAAAAWRAVHVPRIDEIARRQEADVILDRYGNSWTAAELLESTEAYSLLASALFDAALPLAGKEAAAFVENTTARLRRPYADAAMLARAELALSELMAEHDEEP